MHSELKDKAYFNLLAYEWKLRIKSNFFCIKGIIKESKHNLELQLYVGKISNLKNTLTRSL